MYNLDKICCICTNKSNLKHLFEVDSDGVSHYNKLTSSIAEMNFKEMNDQILICEECCVTLNTVYNFRQTCLRSKTNLITYITQTSSHIKIKKEIEVKCEIEDIGHSFEDFSNSKCLLKIKSDPDDISTSNKCCVCLCDQNGLKHMFEVDNHGMSYYNQLTSSIAEMNFKEMNNQRLICEECCVTLNTVYNFRQMCLRSKTNLITHISQLQTSGHISGTVCLKDIKPELIVVKNERGRENEGSNCLEGSNFQIKFKTESSVENIGFSASVKEECESGDDYSPTHEGVTVDHVNEGAHSNIKVEDVEHQTMMEDYSEYYAEFNKIEIEEDPLSIEEEEPSETETPQDGSTSLADTGTKDFDMITHASGRPYQCKICKKDFNFKSGLSVHMKTHSNERPYECLICKKGFKYKFNCTEHMKTHASERQRPHECKICKKNFNFKSSLTVHMKIHASERPYECEICKKGFNYKNSLAAHMKTHATERPYECKICKKSFKSNFARHMNSHSSESSYESKICKKDFNFKSINVHTKTHANERLYECKICKKSLKSNFTRHMNSHSSEKPYECKICKKGFTSSYNLMVHERTHSSERLYECELCKKGFNYKAKLTEHMKAHANERPYECEICKKGFNYKDYLTDHMKAHSNERPFQCEICKKGFNFKNNLTSHMKTHSSEKPFECEICKKRFDKEISCIGHMERHLKKSSIKCEIPDS